MRSKIVASSKPEKNWAWNRSSNCFQVVMDQGASDVYHPDTGPVRDKEKSQIFMCSADAATPN